MAVSKTIEIHSLTKDMEKAGVCQKQKCYCGSTVWNGMDGTVGLIPVTGMQCENSSQ